MNAILLLCLATSGLPVLAWVGIGLLVLMLLSAIGIYNVRVPSSQVGLASPIRPDSGQEVSFPS